MDSNTLIDKKTSRLTPKQTFLLALVFMIGFMGYNIYDRSVTRKLDVARYEKTEAKDDKIVLLLEQLVKAKVNIVDEQGALNLYDKTFKTSRCAILDRVMTTLSVNHVHDSIRQVQLRLYYQTTIMNMYMDDKQKLSHYKYKDKRLDGIFMDIDPQLIINNVLSMMFSNRDTHQKRLDIRGYLYGNFDLFYQKSQTYLKE